METIGMVLNDAIPKMVNTYGAIQGLQERAKAMRMKEELHPLEMEQQQNQNKYLQTQTALGEITLQQKKNELMKQEQLNKIMNNPVSVKDLLHVKEYEQVAPGVMEGVIGDLRNWGALDPVLDSNNQEIDQKITPFKFQTYMEQNKGKFLGRINEGLLKLKDSETALIEQITSGEIKEKDMPQAQKQLQKIQQMKVFWDTQANALEAEFKLTAGTKEYTQTQDVHIGEGKWQKMRFNPQSNNYDIPIGNPFRAEDKKPTDEKVTDFVRKWGKAQKIAQDKYKRKPTEEEVADIFKSKFGSFDLIQFLLGGQGQKTSKEEPIF